MPRQWDDYCETMFRHEITTRFRQRTPPKSVNDCDPSHRVIMSEMLAWARETLGTEPDRWDVAWATSLATWMKRMIERETKKGKTNDAL